MELLPRLPRHAWAVLAGDFVSALGSGLTMPFFVVYLHRMRGIDLALAGLALATVGLASFPGNLLGGSLSDRVGPKRALAIGLCAGAAGAASFAFVRSAPSAVAAAALIGLGASISWPSLDSLLASTVDEPRRSSVFAVRHATLNLGFGCGAIVAVAIVDFGSIRSFQLLYLLDAATFLAMIPLLAALRGVGDRPDHEESSAGGGYREVLADRTFLAVWALTALLATVGYAQYEATVPIYATETGGVSAHGLGPIFAANTFAVAVLQLVVLKLTAGRRRTSALCAASVALGCAWLLAIGAAHIGGGARAIAGFAAAMAVLALAETLLTPALAPIVNELAPDRLRGRYNGTFVLAYTTGFTLGPALAGGGLKLGDGTPYVAALAACAGLAAFGSLRLRARLPAAIDVIGDSNGASSEPVAHVATLRA